MKLKNYLLTITLCIINIVLFFKQRVKSYALYNTPLLLLIILLNTTAKAQNLKPFNIRYATELKGDMLVIGNNILGKNNNPLNDNTTNESVSMQYIDIDNDASTINSSSADLAVPSTVDCFRIAYAGLYWGALIKTGDSRTDIDKIKFKTPGSSTYTDITGELIYDANVAPIDPDANKPYACYANVTSIISGLTSPQGTYTVANVKSSTGLNGTTGLAAGWTLYVVYEDPKTTTKYMVSYDGFSALYDGRTLDIDVTGFQTPPSGSINLKFGFATLNGDKSSNNSNKTKVEISNGTANGTALTTTLRPSNYFFNSSITNLDSYITSRNPNGTNSLGYDTGIEQLLNVNKSTVGNNATDVRFTLQVARGQANPLFSFFNAFQVNVIAPDISLTKIVKNLAGNDIGNTNVVLGQNLYYEIGFQSTGNDNVTNFTLKDVLPNNIIFNYPSDITSLPTGVTHTYNATTRELLFSIPDNLVEVGDVSQTIRLHVQVVSDYSQLTVGCSNEIKNQAFASYRGVIDTTPIVDEGSFSSTVCNFGTPSSTNFLVNIDGQTFTKSEVLCGATATLSAASGYTSYSWSTSPTGTPVIGTNQTYTATSTGTYYVTSTSACRTIKEQITVIPFGNTITNPVIPYADEVVICQNNGKELPNIFLCGANATRLIQTNISDASTITWEKLNESSCAAQTIANCANENTACQWNSVGTGANFLVNTSGQFRVTLNYPGGCFSRFYFNVYQNLLNPTYTTKDIVCTTNGKITIGGVPSGYEYSLDGVTYLPSNIFTITTAGAYTVYIKQVGVTTNPCIFSVPNILIRKRIFSGTTIVTQPLCNGDKGSIKIAAVDADPQYYYSIYQGATLVNSVGPIAASDYEFSGLNPATYTVRVWTDDGCDYSTNIQIIAPAVLTATSALTKPLTCIDGEITVYPVGGTPPYAYYVNGSTSSQSTPQIVVTNPLPTGGIYNIQVVDSKNCSATTSITVATIPPPVYTMSQTNIKCYNDNTGVINFNVTNANGYTLAYSIDNGVTYSSNPTFSNLVAGTYNAIVKYSLSGTDCFSTAQTITLSQPTTALTASAGVSELAGCGPAGEGKIRITNPQGGTLPYEYSFDNQATWITANEAYKAPGTYTVYIRDANGCTYPMSVTIDAQPVAPTIAVDSSSFNCDGTATSTVTVTNNAGSNYSYEYLIDGNLNPNTTDPKVFLNVPSGSHTISVKYQLLSVTTYSNLLKEDFGSGSEVSSPGINTAFCFEKQNFLTCDKNGTLNNGEYTVTNTIKNGIYSGWHNPVDHTAGSATGRYLAVDAGTAIPNNAVLYRKTIQDIIPNQPIQVRFFATNLLKIGNTQPNASLTVELQNSAGTSLSSQSTGGIPKTNGWVEYNLTINPGNNTSLDFVLRLEVAQVNGIDFAVDDIDVYQLPKSCITQKDFPIIIPTGQAFTASITTSQNITCANINNGSITIAAQNFDPTKGFQYSIDNGVNWFTQMTSPYTITGLSGGTYNVKIRYDVTSTGSCVKSFTQTLTAPAPLVTTATVTSVATCTAGATITAGSTGGTAAYRYELWNATGTTNIQPSQNTGIFTNVAPGTYIVRGYDANNCTDDTPVVTVVTPPTVTATLDSSSDLCFDNMNQASLVVNASGGTSPYVYSLDGAPAQNGNTFNNVSVGNHSIIVTDSFGCTAPAITVTIAPQLTTTITNIKELDCTASPNAVITGTITGGNAPFVATVLSGTGPGTIAYPTATTFTYTTAVASTYQFQITDSKGCITTTTATINPLVPVTATLNPVNPSCNGISDGSVQITPSGGVGPYTYSFNGSSFTSTSLYTGLSAGIAYAYEVRDSKNCPFTGTVTLTQPTTLVASATATTFSCSATNTKQSATITIAVPATGTAPYQYSFNGGGYTNINTLTVNDNGTDQTIPYSVRDANGCTAGNSITLSKLNPPTAGTITNSAVTCNSTTSTVTVTPTAGTGVGTLTYEITFPTSAATPNTTGIFNGLTPDTYIFKVTDASGCYYTQSITVAAVTPIAIAGNKTSDVLCKGDSTGSALFTVSGNATVGAYSFALTSGTLGTGTLIQSGNSITLSNVPIGTYTVEVTDSATGCTANTSITITEPAAVLALTATATNVNCNNDNAQITVNASGGTTNYTYAAVISGASAPTIYSNSNIITVDTNSATNLIWDVYVKDAKGCIATTTITLISDALPTIDTPAIQCYVGSPINISITGTSVGVPTYSIGSGYQSSPNFTINAAGTYTLSLKDASGCVATTTYIVYPQLTVLPSITKELDCTASPAATITVTAAGGKSPYAYAVSTDGGSTYTSMGTNVYSTLVAGTFQFKVTDANNCITTATTTINPLIPITTTTINVDPSCNGASDGSVQIIPSGGLAPYTYSSDGITYVPGSLFTGLGDGTYTFYIKDSKACFITKTVTLTEPATLTATASVTPFTCSTSNTKQAATITVTATSGTGTAPYQYSFNGSSYSAANTLTLNDNGLDQSYTYSVRDSKGCIVSGGGTLLKLNPPTDLSFTAAPITCTATTTTVTANGTNGVGTLTYEIVFPGASATLNTTGIFAGLSPGTYIFKVTDANGCYYTESHIVNPVTPIAILGNKTSDVLCKGDNSGSIQYTVSGFSGTYSYVFNGQAAVTGQTSTSIIKNGLPIGTYLITVTDEATGCTANSSITITEPTDALTFIATPTNVNCNNYNSQITVNVSGGTTNYTYAAVISGTSAPTTYSNSNIITVDTNLGANLSWDVYVKDANGCVTNNTLSPTTVTLDPMPTVTTTPLATDQCTSNGSSYSFTATGTGVAPLTYSIGGSFQASPVFTVVATGLYTITVKDGNGCTNTATITVYPVLTSTAVLTADLDCIAPTDATIRIDAGGGKSPYSYLVSVNGGTYSSTGISGNVFTTNSAGTFLFEVTDANGCKKISNPITINPKVDPEITFLDQIQDIYCNGEATASIRATIDTSKGIAPFTYSIDGTNFQVSNVFSGLVAGTYTVTVKDSKGCMDTETIIIGQPNALNYTLTKTDIECTGPPPSINLGSITVNIGSGLGGTAPYTYILTNNVGAPTQTESNNPGTNFTFTGLNYGTYAVSIVDANGCTLKQNMSVTSPPNDLTIDIQSTASCSAGGIVKVTATSGLLGAGPFYFAIYQRDAVSGLYPGVPNVNAGVPDAPYFTEDTPGTPTATFTGLTQGVFYSFIVYDSATGCSYIKQASAPTIKVTSLATLRVVTDVTCKGAADGTVSITLSTDSTDPLYTAPTSVDYVVYNSLTNMPIANQGSGITVGAYPFTMPLIGGLSPGSYYVVITEHGGTNNGCSSATLPFDIYESATDLTLTATVVKNDNCSSEGGQIVAIAQGGTTMSREDLLAVPPQMSAPVPYQYQILSDTGTIGDASDDTPPTFSDSNWATDNFFEKDSGNYIVYAMDANKCIKSFPITLSLDPSPVITLAATDNCAVEGAFEIVVNEATAGVAPYSISVNGSAYQNFSFVPGTPNSYTISNLNSGTYNISVQDVNGCVATETITLYKKVSASSILNKEWTCTTGDANALITTNIFDGEGVFSYKVSINGGAYGSSTNVVGNSFTYSPAPLGTTTSYQFEITDANGCIVETNVISIEPIENPTATTIVTNATCSGTSNGSVTIIPSLGVPPYTFSFNGSGFTSNATYGGLAGSVLGTVYNYQVKDSYDCIFNGTATVFEPTPVAGTIALTQGLTCGTGNATQAATVTVTPTLGSGTAPYYYSFDGGLNYSSNNVFTTNVAGNVNALIKDGNGCVITVALTVPVPVLVPPTDLMFSTTSAVTCLAPGTVEITGHTGGVGILQYETIAPSPIIVPKQTTTTFAGLTPGTYLFQVTDANGCTYQESYTVNPVTNITVSGQLISDVTCNPGANGEVLFTVANFAGTYTYSINGAAASAPQSNPTVTISGLSTASTQTIVVTDVITGCTATASINVAQPAPLALVANPFINANCNFGAQVSVTAFGGVAPYSYSYVINGAPAGTYSTSASAVLDPAIATSWDVYVKDANGCIITTPLAITITKDALPIIVMPASQCFVGTPLTIDLSAVQTVAVGPATYTINGSNQTSPIYTITAPGTYKLSIVDANGCSSNVVDYIVQPQLSLNAALTKELDCTTSPDAVVTLTAGGGTTPYTLYEYSSNAGASYTAMASNVLTTSTAGSYIFRVTDTQGCQAVSSEVTITPKTTPTFTFTQTNVSCNGGSDGSIVITAANGIAPYQYSIDNGATYQPSNVFTGLNAAGTYTVVVKDSKSCNSLPQTSTITEPTIVGGTAALTQGLTCGAGNATQAALVTVTGSGGTGAYEYSFDGINYSSTNTYSTNVAGMVTAYIKDANGCISVVPATANVPALNPPTDLNFVSTTVTCLALTSDVTLTATNGVGALNYAILSPASATSNATGASSGIFTGLLPNTYLFQVTDANSCTYQESYTVNPVTNITVSGQLISDVTCNPGSNGQVLFTIGNFAATYSYSINGVPTATGQTNPTITLSGLSTGTQTIVVTDETTGCTATTSVAVAQPAPLALVANPFINANCNFGAQVSVTASGGVAPYSYSYVISGTPAGTYSTSASTVLNPATATAWDVWVKDANGCVITTPLAITIATDPLPSVTVNPYSQCPSATGTYDFTVAASGMAPFEYSIGSGFQTSPTFTVNASGTYNVTVKDKNGCTTTVSGLVNILPALQLQATITGLPSCTDGDGALTLTATGGSGNYEYRIDSGTYQPSANFTAISSGLHAVTVRDVTTNCTKSIPVNLGAATPITGFAISKTDVTCNGGSNGVITATITTPSPGVNDNPVYNYSLSGTAIRPAQLSNIFNGLTAGNYTVTVTSARGCTATTPITIVEPAIITVPAPTVAQFGCNSGSNAMNFATITVTGVTGGSGIYNYEFIKGGTVVQSGNNNIYTEANLLGGTYTVNVYDSKGCIGSAPATISIVPFIALDKINVAVNNTITCTNPEDITISATTIGGTPASLQYTLVDVSGTIVFLPNTTGIFTGLPIGDYIITVTNPTTGCSIQDVHYVNEPNTFDLNINSVSDVSCFGGTNGTANVTLIDRVITASNPNQAGAFSYTIVDTLGSSVQSGTSATAGPLTISALAAGTYTITATLTNSPFCTVSKNFTISQPSAALTIAETHTAITCISGNNDGSISATAIGGWPGGYQFELVGPVTVAYSSQSYFNNLTAGTYTVNVKDSKGCVATTTVTLVVPTPINATATPNTTLLSCFGDKNAIITVSNTTGGQGSNYSYTLNMISPTASSSGPQLSPIFSGLGAGTYSVTVKDGYNCSFTSANIVIAEPTVIKANLVVASTQTCLNQTQLTLTASGGTAPYFYSVDNVTYSAASFAPLVTFPVAAGTYSYYVKDANGCVATVSNSITIDPLPALTINLDLTNAVINCKGDASGVIVAKAQGGLGNYIYTLLDGSGNAISPTPTQLNPGNFTALLAGNYMVKVDSGDCPKTSALITIKEPLLQLAETHTVKNVSCNGAKNGEIVINASNGTGIIQYAISPNLNQFDDVNTFKNLKPGNYDVIVQDQTGCFIKINFDITEPELLTVSTIPNSIVPEICAGDKDGAFSITIGGGSAPYSVSLDNVNGTYTTGGLSQTDFDFTELTGGNHVVYIRDAAGCNINWSVLLPESVNMNPMATINYDCVNNAAANSVTVTIDASVTNPADVDYSLDGGTYQPENIFTNLVPGTHYVTTRHTNGCEQRTLDFNIVQVDPLTLVLNDGGLNEIVATAAGGGGNYQYTLNGESYGNTSNFIIYKSGDYTVTVTDTNGCVASATRHFEYIDVCIPNHFTPNGDGIEDGWAPGCTINYTNLTFDIFDRYGRKVATYRLGQYWDGKYDGKELPSGDYWYVLKLNDVKDPREFVGHFTLYR